MLHLGPRDCEAGQWCCRQAGLCGRKGRCCQARPCKRARPANGRGCLVVQDTYRDFDLIIIDEAQDLNAVTRQLLIDNQACAARAS